MVTDTPIKIQIVKSLSNLKPSRMIAVKGDSESSFSLYVTDKNGVPYPLKDLQGSGTLSLTNTDGNLTITGTNDKVINISSSLLSVINSALQSGANISELVNDQGYITLVDLPNNTSDLINNGANNTSTYVETDELGAVAFSNDYDDLDNLPIITSITNHSGLTLDDGTNPHGVTKADVGLSNVDNTSDLNKPVSTATQNALDTKQVTLVSGTNIKTVNGNSILGSGDLVISGVADTQVYKTDITSRAINDTDHNAFARVKSNLTYTLPSGLRSDFIFTGRVYSGVTLTFTAGAGVTTSSESDGLTFTGKGMFLVFVDGSNNYVICGEI